MQISGLQKLTLLDFPGQVACTIFTRGCNYRCPFCHNASLVTHTCDAPLIDEEEILSFLKKRHGILDGVCITGGEPMMQTDLEDFIRKIKKIGYKVKLDTNGSFPDRLRKIIEEGLVDYVAMDVKNSKEKYGITAGISEKLVEKTLKSIDILKENKVDYEFRTTVVINYHSEEDFEKIGSLLLGAKRYFLQGFIDSGDILADGCVAPKKEEMEKYLEIIKKYIKNAEIRGM